MIKALLRAATAALEIWKFNAQRAASRAEREAAMKWPQEMRVQRALIRNLQERSRQAFAAGDSALGLEYNEQAAVELSYYDLLTQAWESEIAAQKGDAAGG